jgi:AraC family transcriptional regulator
MHDDPEAERMGANESAAQTSTPEAIARAVGKRPLFMMESPTSTGLAAAKWLFLGNTPFGGVYPASILAFRAAGSASVTRICAGRTTRKRPRIGSVTFVAGDSEARWILDDTVEAVHLYLPRTRVESFVAQHVDGTPGLRIDDFFGIEDAWLQGYFHMLLSELDSSDSLHQPADTLLLDQTEHLVLRHLVRWHSNAAPHEVRGLDLQSKHNPLRPALLRRIEDYVYANLTRDIALADLAGLCAMSVDHFLRSFRAATGITPYRYVLEQRLRRARVLLKTTDTPIASIATTCGFRNGSNFSVKFHARFNASPSEYRRNA